MNDFLSVGVLPLLVLIAFPLLWWRGTRAGRLWFVFLAPLALICGIEVGSNSAGSGGTCLAGSCDRMATSMAGVDATLNDPWVSNCMAALLVGAPFGLLTALVDTLTAFSNDEDDTQTG